MKPQTLNEFLTWEAPHLDPILGQGLMFRGSKVILYGRYKSLKSMLALRFTLSISNGKSWLGFNTLDDGLSVLHLQLEIPHPLLQRRVLRMSTTSTGAVESRSKAPAYFWTEHVLKLDSNQGFDEIAYNLEHTKADVLVLDPLYKLIGGDIISPSGVQKFIDNIDQLIADFNISVLLVSHTRKGIIEDRDWGNSDDMIGSSYFSNWADTLMRVERDKFGGGINVNFEVVRHAEEELGKRHYELSNELDFIYQPENMLEMGLNE